MLYLKNHLRTVVYLHDLIWKYIQTICGHLCAGAERFRRWLLVGIALILAQCYSNPEILDTNSDTRQQWLPGVRTHDTQPEKTIDDPHYLSVTRRRLQHKVQGTPSHSPRRLYKHMWGCGGGGSEEMIFMSPENFGNEMRNKIAHIPIILSTSCPHNCQCSLLTDNMTLKSRLSGEQTSSITRAVSQF